MTKPLPQRRGPLHALFRSREDPLPPEPQEDSRCDQYRDLLEHWAAWWNGPGRQYYANNLLPPITKTGEALRCSICAGESGEGRCAACGRRMSS